MAKRYIVYALIVVLIFSGALAALKHANPNLRIEGYSGWIFERFFSHGGTQFATGYSNRTFLKIRIGMTEEEVLDLLGEPLSRWCPSDYKVGFQYSRSTTSDHYRLRQVYFEEAKVCDIIGYYYLD